MSDLQICLAGTLVCFVVSLSIGILLSCQRRKLQYDLARKRKSNV